MRFFEAIEYIDKKKQKPGYKVFGYDMQGNKYPIFGRGDILDWDEAKELAWNSKMTGRYWRTQIIDPQGNEVPPAGGLMPRKRDWRM